LLEELLKAGNAVIIISSYLPEIMGIADRIAVICEGRFVKMIKRGNYDDEELLRYASGIK